jgi:hypothetical protein
MGDCIFEQEKQNPQKKGGPSPWYDVQAFLVNLSLCLIDSISTAWLSNIKLKSIPRDEKVMAPVK